jgi:hypothetical protein
MVDFAEEEHGRRERQMSFVHPFGFEFKRLAYETIKRGR